MTAASAYTLSAVAVSVLTIAGLLLRVGQRAGQVEEHLAEQDKVSEELRATLAAQDKVLDAQNAALAELRARVEALHDQR